VKAPASGWFGRQQQFVRCECVFVGMRFDKTVVSGPYVHRLVRMWMLAWQSTSTPHVHTRCCTATATATLYSWAGLSKQYGFTCVDLLHDEHL